jgi:hypothetical protein
MKKDVIIFRVNPELKNELKKKAKNENRSLNNYLENLLSKQLPNVDNKENLFPIYYRGKNYYKEDCDETFLSIYDDMRILNTDKGIYISGGESIYPDGEINEYF